MRGGGPLLLCSCSRALHCAGGLPQLLRSGRSSQPSACYHRAQLLPLLLLLWRCGLRRAVLQRGRRRGGILPALPAALLPGHGPDTGTGTSHVPVPQTLYPYLSLRPSTLMMWEGECMWCYALLEMLGDLCHCHWACSTRRFGRTCSAWPRGPHAQRRTRRRWQVGRAGCSMHPPSWAFP